MKKLLLLLLIFTNTALSGDFQYRFGIGYRYDSNIGQNINEEGNGYWIPDGYLKYSHNSLFLKVASTYENHLDDRSPLLNSPFLSISGGRDFGNDNFSLSSELKTALYYGNGTVPGDTDAGIHPVKYSYRWYNDMYWKVGVNRILFSSKMQINDYGDDSQNAFRWNLRPEFQWRFRSSNGFRLRSISLFSEYEGNYAQDTVFSYTLWEIGSNSILYLGRSKLNVGLSFITKSFGTSIEHPITEDTITVRNNYFYTSGRYTIPLISNFDLELHGKLRFKGSNNPTYDWNRHTVGVTLIWRSKFGE